MPSAYNQEKLALSGGAGGSTCKVVQGHPADRTGSDAGCRGGKRRLSGKPVEQRTQEERLTRPCTTGEEDGGAPQDLAQHRLLLVRNEAADARR
eukprot:1339039-Pleurochrysis_carterae.AAC.2